MTTEKLWLHRHDDDEWYDEVSITTVPRYKTSGLSGDEWRVSALVQFKRKGIVVHEEGYTALQYAVAFLNADWIRSLEQGIGDDTPFKHLCMQPGCDQPATTVYRLKQVYCNEGHGGDPGFPMYRQFCLRHSRRGDCGLEDSDTNYEVISGHGPKDYWEHQESPAAFGGIVVLDGDETS